MPLETKQSTTELEYARGSVAEDDGGTAEWGSLSYCFLDKQTQFFNTICFPFVFLLSPTFIF